MPKLEDEIVDGGSYCPGLGAITNLQGAHVGAITKDGGPEVMLPRHVRRVYWPGEDGRWY